MPADPADYVRAVEQHRYFEVLSLTGEDFQRTEYYRANAQRLQAAASETDLDGFLRSLNMRARLAPISDINLERAVQLIGKSNQFNLTTRRHSTGDLQRMIVSPDWVTCTVNLSDRFGDNGLISVILAHERDDALDIDTWLMSCRVLQRGVEQFLLNHLVDVARKRGLRRVTGEYIPTAKNALVQDHYANLRFARIHAEQHGRTRWQLDIPDPWTPLPHCILQEAP
jgi:FkbH-like protein